MNDISYDWNSIRARFHTVQGGYSILQYRLLNLLPTVLENARIELLGVFGRIKKFESFKDKIERNGYAKPFEEIEDICGVRVIYYAKSDLNKILDAIKGSGLEIVSEEDKRTAQPVNSFGYGAYHLIVTLPETWTEGENKALRGLRGEIQVTSVTEHLWAKLSHKTEYKLNALDEENKRRLYRLPGILEIFDDYAELIAASLPSPVQSTLTTGELRSFLNHAFPDRARIEVQDIHSLLQNVIHYVSSKEELEGYWRKWKDEFQKVERETYRVIGQTGRWREDGALRALLELSNDKYWDEYQFYTPAEWKKIIVDWRKRMGKS